MKEPSLSERVVLSTKPSALRTWTVAPAITAPEVSTTVPDRTLSLAAAVLFSCAT
jgi:hypothetical protein